MESQRDVKVRTNMMKFTRSPGFQSNELSVENILRLPGGGGDPTSVGLSTSSNFLQEQYRKQEALGELNDHSCPLVQVSKKLCVLPMNEVVWSYHGSCYKGVAPINPYKRNQDAFVSEVDESTDTLLLAVCDGHGQHGDRCASWVQRELPMRLFAHSAWAHDPIASYKVVCKDMNAILANTDEAKKIFIDTQFSGTTVTAVAVRAGMLYVMHLGECRAVLGSARPHLSHSGSTILSGGSSARSEFYEFSSEKTPLLATRITVDHRPGDIEEKRRILAAGGRVFGISYDDGTIGPSRLWLPTLDVPGLTISRSLGDGIGKEFAGLSDNPDFMEVELEGQYSNDQKIGSKRGQGRGDGILILATDGLWEKISDQEAIDICVRCDGDAAEMAETLINEAQKRWVASAFQRSDDTTVVVALLCDYKKKWH
jgi:serine/threonine protein phosphatase PrpC